MKSILSFNEYQADKLLQEKVLDPQQLNLFDDAFSGKTIAQTFLHKYALEEEIVCNNTVTTIDEAIVFLELRRPKNSTDYFDILLNHLQREHRPDDTKMKVFRAMTLPYSVEKLHTQTKEYNGIGYCWSYVTLGARAYDGVNTNNFFTLILEAEVNIKNIDWGATYAKACYNLSDEQEIQLNDGVSVAVTDFSFNCDATHRLDRRAMHYFSKLLQIPREKTMEIVDKLTDGRVVHLESPLHVRV